MRRRRRKSAIGDLHFALALYGFLCCPWMNNVDEEEESRDASFRERKK